jgi:predicted GIY-YIG superfamily endonuclease
MTKYIYVISCASSDEAPCKIGISDNPEKRVKQLQTGHPKKLKIKYTKELDNARLYEKRLHKDMSYLRSHGEWFNLSVSEAIEQINFTLVHHESSELIP